jgi:TnpA family transposase
VRAVDCDCLGVRISESGDSFARTHIIPARIHPDVELRLRIHIGLNKGEARNALARAVFFNRPGELRDRKLENQQHRAGGLNLVVAAIVLWNTVYLERETCSLSAARETFSISATATK